MIDLSYRSSSDNAKPSPQTGDESKSETDEEDDDGECMFNRQLMCPHGETAIHQDVWEACSLTGQVNFGELRLAVSPEEWHSITAAYFEKTFEASGEVLANSTECRRRE